ncbi:hypothetical protein RFI02_16330 [Acinetobacter sichuanensis]|uniref:hypothetical protein n=1 Tax=Acinetobacter sichuanensis TaxID=2136183 RepID=UPI00280EE004|nr:hypothetical protein [Acinetobacter sichuanensis]MDQ9022680.1 hypothetical protein [Acinetobacter sichuanensis]
MPLNKLAYCVQQSGYTVSHGNNVIVQELEGGSSRYRRGINNNSHTVNVNWVVNKTGYDYLVAFYNLWTYNPSKPFLALLIIDDSDLKEYKCFFKSGFQLDSKEGNVFKVSATFEVQANRRDKNLDQSIVDLGNEGLINSYINIEKVPNVWLPNALGV